MKEYYTLNDLCVMTGFTARTLRGYLATGVLEGEKEGGVWRFTEEQVKAFIASPSIWPGIQSKQSAAVRDFFQDRGKQEPQMCVILDLPGYDAEKTTAFFCREASDGGSAPGVYLWLERQGRHLRVILTGQAERVLGLVNLFYREGC